MEQKWKVVIVFTLVFSLWTNYSWTVKEYLAASEFRRQAGCSSGPDAHWDWARLSFEFYGPKECRTQTVGSDIEGL